jgi:hypothetical protein
MNSDFLKQRAAHCRFLAERAEPFIKRRLLDLAAKYEARFPEEISINLTALVVPVGVHQWEWSCGFFPGCEPWEHLDGTALDFFTAHRELEAAWRDLSATRTQADYQEWRDQRDRIARKYPSWARGEKPPPPTSVMRCACGISFDNHKPAESYDHRGHIYAAHAEGRRW